MPRLLALVPLVPLLLAACAAPGAAPSRPPGPGPARVLALGDSYTVGEGVQTAETWPHRLAARLRAEGHDVADPQVIATTGWTTDELAAAITAARPRGPFGLVTLLIGVNDQYRGRPLDEYRTQVRALIGRAVGFAGGDARRVVAVSFPDWGVTPFGQRDARGAARIAREVDAFNAVARAEAAAQGVAWVDVMGLSRAYPAELAADGLHPSGAQYARWAEAVLPAAEAALAVR